MPLREPRLRDVTHVTARFARRYRLSEPRANNKLHFELALQALIDTGYEVHAYFYAPRSNEIGRSVLQKAFRLPRAVLYAMNRDFAIRLLGRYRFMVLAQ
jgi:hypothetical protein